MNYATIFEYLIQNLGIQGKNLADWLNIDASIISKIKSNKRSMQKGITIESIYKNIFEHDEIKKDPQGIAQFYTYLKDTGNMTESIDKAYNKYTDSESAEMAKEFIITVLRDTKYEKEDATESSSVLSKSKGNNTTSSSISFEPFTNPIQNNEVFGRTDICYDIHEKLSDLGTCIIYGIGGLGKSYCSLKYALDYNDSYTQIQQVIFNTDIKTTVLKIKLKGLDETHFSEDEKFEKRLSILSSFDEHTLLIIDNMDTHPQDRDNYERLKKLPIHILFTSRETDLDSNKYLLPIRPLAPEEQLELFMHYGQFRIDECEYPEYLRIFEMVEGHTLLLELIAKTMAVETLTTNEMIEILYMPEYNEISAVPIEKDDTYQQEKMNNYVSKLFDTTKLSDLQKDILMNLSLTSIHGISQRLFKQFLQYENSDINSLIRQSWIIQERPSGPASAQIHLHPVIRTAVINNTEPSLEKCIDFLNRTIEYMDTHTEDKQNTADLCDILVNCSSMFSFNSENLDIIYKIALILWHNLMYIESYTYLITGLKLLNKTCDASEIMCIDFYEMAGKVAVRLANYEGAIKHYQSAINIIENSTLHFEKKLAALYDKLGVVMRKASNYEQALDYFTKAQNIIDINHIDDPVLSSDIYNDMGVIYINLDIFDKALENYQKARAIRESAPIPNKEQIAYSYHNIGTVYQRQKKYDDAITWHKKALDIREEIYQANEPIIAASLTMIGNDYTNAAMSDSSYDIMDAYDYFKKGLEIRELTLGETHPDTAWSHQSLGAWYFYQKKYNLAIEHYLKCLHIRQAILQKNHAYTAEILYLLGEVYYAIQDTTNARKYLLQAKEIQENLHKIKALEKTVKLLDAISDTL